MNILPPSRDPVTPDDLKKMWRCFSGLDGHTREKADIEIWMVSARAARWTRAQAAAATLAILGSWTGYRVMPGHVTTQIREDREQIRLRWYCPDPPKHLRDNPPAEIAWRRRAQADFADRALMAMAAGQALDDVPLVLDVDPEPQRALPPAEQTRRMTEMVDMVAQRKAVPPADYPVPGQRSETRRMDDDLRQIVEAELNSRRPPTESSAEASA